MKKSLKDTLASVGLLLLRLGGGGFMMTHGYGKLTKFSEKAAGWAEKDFLGLGLGGQVELGLVVFAEFFCALGVALGFCTRLACIPLVIAMLVAAFVAHGADPFANKEKALLYVTIYLTLVFTGPGKFALDHWIEPRLPWTMKKPDAE